MHLHNFRKKVQKLKRNPKEPELSLITMALQGKKAGFAKVP